MDAEFSRTHEKLTVLQCSLTGIITTEKHIMLEWGRKWYEIWYAPNITGAWLPILEWCWELSSRTQSDSHCYFFHQLSRHGCHIDNLIRWIIQILLYHRDMTCTYAPRAPWFCQWNDCPLSAHWYCFIHALHFFLKLLSPVCFQGNEYVCSDMSYSIPKEIKLSLVICIDFPLPTKISFKSIAICRKTEDRNDNWWIIFNAFLNSCHSWQIPWNAVMQGDAKLSAFH